MVVPRTQWVEWWFLGEYTAWQEPASLPDLTALGDLTELRTKLIFHTSDHDPVPFLSRGCSWSCLPRVPERRLPTSGAADEFAVQPIF
jgi:hypothetical protein